MRRPYAGFLAVTALVVLAEQAASQCDNLPCEPRPSTNTLTTVDDYGGFSVAVDGDVAVAGAPGDYNSPYPFGAAYVYERQPSGEWVAVTRLQKSSPGTMDTQFGFSVDIIGDTILVGDLTISAPGIGSGAVYVYEQPAGGWADLDVNMDGIRDAPLTENAMLVATEVGGPPATNAGIRCGRSVALADGGATAYVGAPFWHDQIPFSGRRTEGRVLVFRRSGASLGNSGSPPTLNEVAQLGRSAALLTEFTSIGWSLDIIANPGGGERVVAGGVADNAASSGTHHGVWVWDEPAGGWESSMTTQYGIPVNYAPAAMSGPDPFTTRHSFGEDVSFLDRLTVAVGSPSERGAHVYVETAPGTWTQEGPLIEPCATIDPFGTGLAFMPDGTLLVGSWGGGVTGVFTYERVPDPMNPGLFLWAGLNRILPRVLLPQNPFLEFGYSLAVSGNTCLVGAPIGYPGQPNRAGTVYELALDCACVTPPTGITNWWTGDTDFTDLVGGQHGTQVGNTFVDPGLAGSAFNLDSTGDAVDLGTTAGNFGTTDFTAELWAWLPASGSNTPYSVLFEKHDGSQGWWIDNISFGSNLRFVADSGGTHVELSASGINTFAASRWTHFAVTRSGITYTLYVNGDVVAQMDDVAVDVSSSAPLYLGANQSLTGSVGGWLDEPALYSRALSQAEIRDIVFAYGAGKCKDIDLTPPVAMITGPNPARRSRGTVPFTCDATDADSGVSHVNFYVDGALIGMDTTAPYEVPLDTMTLSNGSHGLFVEAFDGAGNRGVDSSRVLVKRAGPGGRRYNGPDPTDVDGGLSDVGLMIGPRGRNVIALVSLPEGAPDVNLPHEFEVKVRGGRPVRAKAHRVLTGEPTTVVLAFDRRELLGSVAAAISSGAAQLRPGIEVELYVDGRPAGPLELR